MVEELNRKSPDWLLSLVIGGSGILLAVIVHFFVRP